MKIRIGVSAGAGSADPGQLVELAGSLEDLHFDSLWLPEILTAPVVDPLIGLAWVAPQVDRLKLGTTMILPGRNPLGLAKETASLDALCGGRFLLTVVPGLPRNPERDAIGVPPDRRGQAMEDVMPVLRRLWGGEAVTHDGDGWRLDEVTLAPRPVQEPFEVWVGGRARASLQRCGRLFDGWLPSLCTPEEAAAGREVIEAAASGAGRAISDEHYGVSLVYADQPLSVESARPLSSLSRGRSVAELVPIGMKALRDLLERFISVGFSKFVVRPLTTPATWRPELVRLAEAVGDLQT